MAKKKEDISEEGRIMFLYEFLEGENFDDYDHLADLFLRLKGYGLETKISERKYRTLVKELKEI